MGLFDRLFKKNQSEKTDAEALNKELNDGLSKTRRGFMEKVFGVLSGKEIDDDLYDELEEALIQGDVGVNTALDLVERLREREKRDHLKTSADLQEAFADELVQLLGEEEEPLKLEPDTLNIILFVGVNGVGKTTSIGKIAWQLKEQGHKVILGAADTFRAAAADQLKIWGERVGCDVIAHQEGADPAAVVFDAIAAAKSRGCDVLLVDTAGRLQNKVNLMNELAKIRKIIDREAPDSLRDVLLVLDATTERAQSGEGFQRYCRRHRRDPDQARRHRQGRRGHRCQSRVRSAGEIHRRWRAEGASAGVQSTHLCRSAVPWFWRRRPVGNS